MSTEHKLVGRDGRIINPAFRVPRYEDYPHTAVSENLEINKPSDIFEDTETREALESVIDSILTQAGCGSAAQLDVVHHQDGTETWTLTAYEDSIPDDSKEKENALVITLDVDSGGIITRSEGIDGYSPALNCRIDAQGFLDFLRDQANEYVISRSAGDSATGEDSNVLDTNISPMNINLREAAQNIARAVETTVQSVGADYIIDLTKVYSSTLAENALATYTGNFSDKNKMPHKMTVVIVPYKGSLAMVIYVDDEAVKTLEGISDSEGLADWVRDSVAYRMNEGRRMTLKSVPRIK